MTAEEKQKLNIDSVSPSQVSHYVFKKKKDSQSQNLKNGLYSPETPSRLINKLVVQGIEVKLNLNNPTIKSPSSKNAFKIQQML